MLRGTPYRAPAKPVPLDELTPVVAQPEADEEALPLHLSIPLGVASSAVAGGFLCAGTSPVAATALILSGMTGAIIATLLGVLHDLRAA